MENTKEYICRAVVSVVDHLGTVSANLNGCLSQTNAFSEAELRINCLKQVSFFFFLIIYIYIYIYIYSFADHSRSFIMHACQSTIYIYIYRWKITKLKQELFVKLVWCFDRDFSFANNMPTSSL
jgi:hypothetical protein